MVVVEVPASSAVPPKGLRKARSEVACAGSADRQRAGRGVEGRRARRVGERFRLSRRAETAATRLLGRLSQSSRAGRVRHGRRLVLAVANLQQCRFNHLVTVPQRRLILSVLSSISSEA